MSKYQISQKVKYTLIGLSALLFFSIIIYSYKNTKNSSPTPNVTPYPSPHNTTPYPSPHNTTPYPSPHFTTQPSPHNTTPYPSPHNTTPYPSPHITTPYPSPHFTSPQPSHNTTPIPTFDINKIYGTWFWDWYNGNDFIGRVKFIITSDSVTYIINKDIFSTGTINKINNTIEFVNDNNQLFIIKFSYDNSLDKLSITFPNEPTRIFNRQ